MKIAVLLSGGVDSSVALARLRADGHDVTAFYLKVWLEDELSYLGECPWEEDLDHARQVCDILGVPLEVVSLQRAYWDRVVRYALEELRAGRTPSPDVLCNQRIKFGAFAEQLGDRFERVASGHYARVTRSGDGRARLQKATDVAKDQTYFLSHVSQEQLQRLLFPLGGLTKPEVRALAREHGLPNASRPDSQGICFLGKIRYRDFVRHHLGEREGDVVELESGRLLGAHRGYWFHTIGQRQGLGLAHGPWFVHSKDVGRNVLYVSHQEALPRAARQGYEVENLHWIVERPDRRSLEVKLRHGPTVLKADVELRGEVGVVSLERKEPGIAPGQFTVFYDGEWCLGGATVADS